MRATQLTAALANDPDTLSLQAPVCGQVRDQDGRVFSLIRERDASGQLGARLVVENSVPPFATMNVTIPELSEAVEVCRPLIPPSSLKTACRTTRR